MAYKWHHLVVTILCMVAVAAIVCSLVSTFNSIHNMKKKRKRSVTLEDSSDDFNVMEINQIMLDSPTKRNTDDRILGVVSDDDFMAGRGDTVKNDFMMNESPVKYLAPLSHKLAKNFTETDLAIQKFNIAKNNERQISTTKQLSSELSATTSKDQSKDLNQNSLLLNDPLKSSSKNTNPTTQSNGKANTNDQPLTKVKTPPTVPKVKVKPPSSSPSLPVTSTYAPKFINGVEIPVFPRDYHASGLLILPRSGIAEPFEIWYAPSVDKSRIDYYYGEYIFFTFLQKSDCDNMTLPGSYD